jgi:hypothetical protein
VDSYLLSDQSAIAAFDGKNPGKPILVKRLDKTFSDYYLLPFGKFNKNGVFLVSGVIILDAQGGHFKEASWTQVPERLLNIDKIHALWLIQSYVLNDLRGKKTGDSYLDYCKLLRFIDNAAAGLVWQPNTYSASPYKPYWKIDSGGYIWYVTQEGKVILQTQLQEIIKEIKTNRIYLENSLKWRR